MKSNDPFTISVTEGRWPNRKYFDVLPGSVLFRDCPKEEYIDWLYDAVQTDDKVAQEIAAIVEAVSAGQLMVRIVVPNRNKDFRGNAVIELIKQVTQQP
jgi:hypothetical protein